MLLGCRILLGYQTQSPVSPTSTSCCFADLVEGISTRLGYHCRFPVDVLKNVLSFLALEVLDDADRTSTYSISTDDFEFDDVLSDHSTLSADCPRLNQSPVRALRAVQQTSSAIYQIATPYLYQNLRITHHKLIVLLRQFEHVTRVHEVINLDPGNDSHPLDYHLYHRLQWTLSFVEELHLTVYSNHDMAVALLSDYTNICTALDVFGRPPLWPALNKVGVRVRDIDGRETADQDATHAFLTGAQSCTP
jgi:hypothetical protein